MGPAVSDFEVKISITSPLDSVDSNGTSLPLTRAPMHLCPTSVCTAYAKSTGVDPVGNGITSPFGVKTYTSWLDRSNRNASRNSLGSAASRCQSSNCRSQVISSMCAGGPTIWVPLCSLYFQCAAMPNSAVRCIA